MNGGTRAYVTLAEHQHLYNQGGVLTTTHLRQ